MSAVTDPFRGHCRFLAERLRSAYFLALAGTGDQRGRSARIAYLSDSSEAWIAGPGRNDQRHHA
jgi:hypothetical protein